MAPVPDGYDLCEYLHNLIIATGEENIRSIVMNHACSRRQAYKNCYEILNAHAQLLYISLSLMLDVYTGY